MPDSKLSFGRYFTLAYEDTARVVRAMWPALLGMVFIMLAVSILIGLGGRFVGTRLGAAGLDLVSGAAIAYAIAPYLFAFIRAVATGQVTTNPESIRTAPATQKFAAWLVVLFIVATLYDFVFKLFGPRLPADATAEQLTATTINPTLAFIVLLLLAGSLIFSVRVTTLLPMLALEPDDASLPRALSQSKGRFWFIAGLLLVVGLPVGIGSFLMLIVVGGLLGPLALFVALPLSYIMLALTLLVGIATSTRLYQRYSD